jgi:excisionase family DNA binding protein
MQTSADSRNLKTSDRLALSVAEVSERVGCSAAFVRLEIKNGRLSASRVGRRVLIPVPNVLAWLARGTQR